jgi:hypothetical protein
MAHSGEYKILPNVARVLFAVPASSAQIERDFSVCGDLISPNRASLSQENVDMCAFLNRNKSFVDISQCEAIPVDELHDHVPQYVSYLTDAIPDDYLDDMIVEMFSASASVSESVDISGDEV